jgi:hypothetical protein
MTPAALAAQDQADAREREFDRKAQRVAVWFLIVAAIAAAYCLLAVYGVVPAAPWSPLGKA